jgi:hypothetical protein
MKATEIEIIVKEIREKKEKKIEIKDTDYLEFKKNYEFLYNMCIKEDFDNKQFEFFLFKLKQIEHNTISEYDASVSIGTLLVEKYVKPQIEN